MESLETINRLEIETNKIFYDKKSELLSIYIFDFVFIGTYKKSTKVRKILDDLYNSFGEIPLTRENIFIVDFVTHMPINENVKLKKLKLLAKKEKEEKKEEPKREKVKITPEEQERKKSKKAPVFKEEAKQDVGEFKEKDIELSRDDFGYVKAEEEAILEDFDEAEDYEEVRAVESKPVPSVAPPPPGGPPPAPKAGRAASPDAGPPAEFLRRLEEAPADVIPEPPKPTVYEINMGLQYYSVMMEQSSYLFYVYFSHKELKIVDEEGKTIFETTIRIETIKKEPPILDLRVEGEGFEVHPLYGKVEVKKDAVNPPVMIFSILPIKKKKKTKKEKKEGERRYLHIYINYEEKIINHTILSIIVQPKHFRLDLGPIHLNISKRTALIISFLSVVVAVASLIFTLFSIDTTSSFVDFVSNFAPGLGSILFVTIFLITLFKEGIYPLKEKISYFLNFDKTGVLIK
ncbi:MAG: hypothetical protein ACFE8M_01700 [Candidatus Hermodarchaeota archaeon]